MLGNVAQGRQGKPSLIVRQVVPHVHMLHGDAPRRFCLETGVSELPSSAVLVFVLHESSVRFEWASAE